MNWKRFGKAVLVCVAASALFLASAAVAGEKVAVVSTEDLQAAMAEKTTALQRTLDDLQSCISAKNLLLEEVVARYKEDPSRDNFGRVYVVHFSICNDEARLLSQVCGTSTKLGFHLGDERRRAEAFGQQKRGQLRELEAKLKGMRMEYQELAAKLPELAGAEKDAAERRLQTLKRLIEAEWRSKVELDVSVDRSKKSASRAQQDLGALGLLVDAIRSRRDVTVATLRQSWEKLERGRAISPDPVVESAREGLTGMLKLAAGLRKSIEGRDLPDVVDQEATGQGSLQEQVMSFLGETPSREETASQNKEKEEKQ